MKKEERQATALSRPMTKRQLSRHQRETRLRRIIYLATAGVTVLIVAVLAFGYYRVNYGLGDDPVANVGNTSISTRTLAEAMGYYNSLYYSQAVATQKLIVDNQEAAKTDAAKQKLVDAANLRLRQLSSQLQALDSVALDNLVEGIILKNVAASQGFTIDQADRDRALVSEFDLGVQQLVDGADPSQIQAKLDNPTADDIAAAKATQQQVLANGSIMSGADFNRLILEPDVYRAKVRQTVYANVPTHGPQVHAAHIMSDTEQQAKDALAMLKQGNLDFAATAKQLSTDTSTKDKGGDLGWFPKGVMDPAFEQAAFSLEVGQVSDPVQTSYGWHIIKVLEKSDDRPYDPQILAGLRAQAYQKWLSDQRSQDANKVTYLEDDAKLGWAQAHMPTPPMPTPQPTTAPTQAPSGAAPTTAPAGATPAATPAAPTPQG